MRELTVKAIHAATAEVFSTMIGLALSPGPEYIETGALRRRGGVLSIVGVAGLWAGTGSICCSPEFACRISSQLLLADFDTVNQDVLDAVAEVANMIIGNVKTFLEPTLGPLGLSTPMVIYGGDFVARSLPDTGRIVVPFDCGGERLDVTLALRPNESHEPAAVQHGFRLEKTLQGV